MEGSVNTSGVDEDSGAGEEVGVMGVGPTGVLRNDTVGRSLGSIVCVARCGSASVVLMMDNVAVSMLSVELVVGVDAKLLQAASIRAARNKAAIVLLNIFIFTSLDVCMETPNHVLTRRISV